MNKMGCRKDTTTHRNAVRHSAAAPLTNRQTETDVAQYACSTLHHMHYRHRDYSPALGRFMQHDPLGIIPPTKSSVIFIPIMQFEDGINLYAYVSHDAVNYSDPMGLVKQHSAEECRAIFLDRTGRILDGLSNCLVGCGLSLGESGPAIVACAALSAKGGPLAKVCFGTCITGTGLAGGICGTACAYASGRDLLEAARAQERCLDNACN